MEIIPAADLRGGRCVRLFQGDYDQETVFSDDPVAVAQRWAAEGAPRLHVADLDGAREGRPVNDEAARRIIAAVDRDMPATLRGSREVWHPRFAGSEYKLKVDFRRTKPTKYELCKIDGPCCKLAPDSERQGTIPYEFKTFSEYKVTYGFIEKAGEEPLEFQTCMHSGCGQGPTRV